LPFDIEKKNGGNIQVSVNSFPQSQCRRDSARIYGNHAKAPAGPRKRIKGVDPRLLCESSPFPPTFFFLFVGSIRMCDAKETAFSALITSVVGFNIVLL